MNRSVEHLGGHQPSGRRDHQPRGTGGSIMAHAKQSPKRKRRKITLPAVGAAGVSLALTGGASAASVPMMDQQPQHALPGHEILLGEEEMSDVSLATFYVFDQENRKSIRGELQLARGCGRCGGGGGRCGGAGRCGGGGRCAVARCGGAGRCGVGRCGVARCGVARCGVGRCGGCGVGWWGAGVACSCSCCDTWGFCRVCY